MGEKCQRCDWVYETVYRIDDSLWERISPKKSKAGLLCPECADELARRQGITLFWEAKQGEYPSVVAAKGRDILSEALIEIRAYADLKFDETKNKYFEVLADIANEALDKVFYADGKLKDLKEIETKTEKLQTMVRFWGNRYVHLLQDFIKYTNHYSELARRVRGVPGMSSKDRAANDSAINDLCLIAEDGQRDFQKAVEKLKELDKIAEACLKERLNERN